MTRFSIAAPELARLTHNALAFMSARSAVKVCRILGSGQALIVTSTDLYCCGEDFAVLQDHFAAQTPIDLSREDLVTLDKIARAKKKADVQLEIRHGDGLSVMDDDGTWMPFLDASEKRLPADLWERVDDLLTRLECVTPAIPEALLIDPAIMAKFAKVKCTGETIADLYISSPDDPILVKIGATFRGAIMPVDRSAAAESEGVGSEGLWSTGGDPCT